MNMPMDWVNLFRAGMWKYDTEFHTPSEANSCCFSNIVVDDVAVVADVADAADVGIVECIAMVDANSENGIGTWKT
jgi:hypothetical protein